ncbi:MAG: class I poly(R)-hydroxyalkanoic acid synthase [Emcibacter sp.]|nr:class I poly(R)-hydroxyalkanoic acid synthase [Emcibacter sp.]
MDDTKSDYEQISKELIGMTTEFQKMAYDFLDDHKSQISDIENDPMHIGETLLELTKYYSMRPEQLIEKQMNLWQDYMNLWQNASRKMMGDETVKPLIEPDAGDKRFKDKEWQENNIFDFIKQSYLLTARWLEDAANETKEDADKHEKNKMNFFTRQFIEAMSPTNFAVTNPEVIRETIASNGQNLIKGIENIIRDFDQEKGKITVSMTDRNKFELGKNVATSKGKVIYRNELIELIQYNPTTEKQYQIPLIISPPWINKFYILDLQPKNSLVNWLTNKGYSVFMISWRNPDASMSEMGLDDYMRLGILSAIDKVKEATGEEQVNTVGYCIGGTLLSCSLAHLAAKKKLDQIGCATFLVTQVDFSEAGELTIFVDEKQMDDMNKTMDKKGYLDGSTMANTFNMLRSNDLIWSFVINNYLKGKEPLPFDLLYWNEDCTRLTKACHKQYLHDMYMNNNLVEPGKITLNGTPIDLTKITIPTYIQAAHTDHICPWKSVYKDTWHFSGPKRFILAGSGHIAGVVNPPEAQKYNYWLNDDLPHDPEEWFDNAVSKPGSWWDDWHGWLSKKSGKKISARTPGDGSLEVLEDAPGSYVKVRY